MSLKKLLLSAVVMAGVLHLAAATAQAAAPAPTSANNAAAATASADVDYVSADAAGDDYLNERPAGISDPLEGFNRGIFTVNKGLDTVILRPVSQVYKFVVPEFGRHRVTDFLTNLNEPIVTLNSVLQGNPQNAFVSFWRFVFNSTLGVFGVFDIATHLGVPEEHSEDFGQTLAVWGVGEGPYLVLPLLGPSNLRDTAGLPVDFYANPFQHILKNHINYKINAARIIDVRTRYGKLIDDTYDSSLDPYATFRSLYLQRRHAMINNLGADAEELRSVNVSN